MVVARRFRLNCPRCRKPMSSFTEILFTNQYTVVINGTCCGKQITSGEMNVLELMPNADKGEVTH